MNAVAYETRSILVHYFKNTDDSSIGDGKQPGSVAGVAGVSVLRRTPFRIATAVFWDTST